MKKETHDQAVTIHTTETPATAPARLDALKAIAGMSDRNLCLFHYEKARSIIESLEHVIRNYDDDGEELDPFSRADAGRIASKIEKIINHLSHIQAISEESGQITGRALPEPA